MSELTPSQTVGPYYAYGLTPEGRKTWKPNDLYKWKETAGDNLVTSDASGERIRIEGVIYDGDGAPITGLTKENFKVYENKTNEVEAAKAQTLDASGYGVAVADDAV